MRICFIGDAGSYHIKKWCNWFSKKGHEVYVISLTKGDISCADVRYIDTGADARGKELYKLRYLLAIPKLKEYIEEIKPDIINAHYATSYGLIMALSGIRGYILSVWGSDVYEFPKKSFLHKQMLKFCLKKADFIFSTSNAMAYETKKYTTKDIFITPFGVDVELFNPSKRNRLDDDRFVVGTVKTLVPTYGIDYLIKAVAIVKSKFPDIHINLRIAGKGEYEGNYKSLTEKLKINDITDWLGFITQEQAALEWANMDVAVIPSILESFGVSAVEAQACGTSVLISDAPGLMESTNPGLSSIVVNRCDENAIAEAIVDLYYDKNRRIEMGMNGRDYVLQNYEINNCFENIEDEFNRIANLRK